jgi:creatinine amidohydrolase
MKETARPVRPIDQGDWNLAFLLPHEIVEARDRIGLAVLPLAPIEWHGPHIAMGCDGLLAHGFARRVAAELRCPYFPPLFVGTERERPPDMLESIGFPRDAFIEGMDFPANTVGSGYHREEVFALVVRDTLDILFRRMRFRRVLIVNGHGAYNQKETLDRLCREFNAGSEGGKRATWVYPGFPRSLLAGSIAHAGAEECSILSALWPGCVDLSRLPAAGKLRNVDFAIVDGETFDLSPTEDHTVREKQDPRLHTDPDLGRQYVEKAVKEVVEEVRATLLQGGKGG